MLVTMLVLLAATSTGIFAYYSTSFEIRTAGYARQSAQTHYVAEGSVLASVSEFDAMQGAIITAAQRAPSPPTPIPPDPPIATTSYGYRFYLSDFTATGRPVFDTTDDADGLSLGPTVRQPNFAVDLNDFLMTQVPVPGAGASGTGVTMTYVHVTYTGRGQTGVGSGWTSQGISAETTRSHTLAGPFPGLR